MIFTCCLDPLYMPCFKLTCCLWNHRVLICNARLCHGQHGWVCVNDPVWSYSLKASLKWCFQLQPLNCMFFCNTKLETWVGYLLDVVFWMNTQWYPPRQNLRWITKSWVNYKILDVFFDEYPTNTQWNPWLSHLFVLSFPNKLRSNMCDVYSQFAWRMHPRNLIPEQVGGWLPKWLLQVSNKKRRQTILKCGTNKYGQFKW